MYGVPVWHSSFNQFQKSNIWGSDPMGNLIFLTLGRLLYHRSGWILTTTPQWACKFAVWMWGTITKCLAIHMIYLLIFVLLVFFSHWPLDPSTCSWMMRKWTTTLVPHSSDRMSSMANKLEITTRLDVLKLCQLLSTPTSFSFRLFIVWCPVVIVMLCWFMFTHQIRLLAGVLIRVVNRYHESPNPGNSPNAPPTSNAATAEPLGTGATRKTARTFAPCSSHPRQGLLWLWS